MKDQCSTWFTKASIAILFCYKDIRLDAIMNVLLYSKTVGRLTSY